MTTDFFTYLYILQNCVFENLFIARDAGAQIFETEMHKGYY